MSTGQGIGTFHVKNLWMIVKKVLVAVFYIQTFFVQKWALFFPMVLVPVWAICNYFVGNLTNSKNGIKYYTLFFCVLVYSAVMVFHIHHGNAALNVHGYVWTERFGACLLQKAVSQTCSLVGLLKNTQD